ncbi:conserved hypothetical protein [Isorropodon fossajaponicum endosymbiont JTNG4]|uniref:copper chaperone PCu(A)C n=1 Tax=Isorropodon fossajaponicum symbiont TaxID=883811 RepID=UPI00191510DC|nr:copper chaperone PCu(A)C [Isorropodon fossajaponicum symbiont]BBB23539.1 conserved hypothetical protein [Isorropodon fossajaponicum endosymbiont JTNG4]
MNKMISSLTLVLSLLVITQAGATSHDAADITIHNPWIRSAPPNAPTLGAFMEIHNNSNHNIKLLSANTSGYKRLELHKTEHKNGMMKMIKQDFMPILAHSKLTLKPGSWHIMMVSPELVPSEGDFVMIKLAFDNGLSTTLRAKVRKGNMTMKHQQL